ncbi:MAG: hypothetical protein ACQER7_14550 [Bacteroidota bacterium]
MPYFALTRKQDIILDHLKTRWSKVQSADPEIPGEEILMIFRTLEESAKTMICQKDATTGKLHTLFSLLVLVKSRLDQYNWAFQDVPENALNVYYTDVAFYLSVCYILQRGASDWASFLPDSMLPPSFLAKVNMDEQAYQNAIEKLRENTELLLPDIDWKATPVKDALEKLKTMAEQYKGYQSIPRQIQNMKHNLNDFPPASKADENQILTHLKCIQSKLKCKPSPHTTLDMIAHAAGTGLLMPHDTEDCLSKILAECHKYATPVGLIKKLKSCLKTHINQHRTITYSNQELQLNARETLFDLKDRIKKAKQEAGQVDEEPPDLCWTKSKDEFLELFCELIQSKTICTPNQKDWHATISLVANTFRVPKDRGEDFISSTSLAKYIRGKIGGYF